MSNPRVLFLSLAISALAACHGTLHTGKAGTGGAGHGGTVAVAVAVAAAAAVAVDVAVAADVAVAVAAGGRRHRQMPAARWAEAEVA